MTFREVIDRALTRGMGEERRQETHKIKREKRSGDDRRQQMLAVVHDRRDGNYAHKAILPSHGENPELIKFAIACVMTTPAQIARDLGVSSGMVSQIIHGRTRAAEIEKYISKVTNISLSNLFPRWYPDTNKH